MLCLFSLHFWGQLLCHYNRYSPFFVCRHVIKWPADLQHLIAIIFIASTITEICCEMQGDLFAQLCNRAAPEGQSLWVWSSGPRNGSSGSQPISVSLSNSFCVFCQLIRKSQISLLVRGESQKIRPTEEEVILLEDGKCLIVCRPQSEVDRDVPMSCAHTSGLTLVDQLLNYLQSPSVTQLEFKCYKSNFHLQEFATDEFCKMVI